MVGAAAGGRVIVAETLDPGADDMDWQAAPAFHLPVAWDDVDAVVCIAFACDPEYLRQARAAGKPVVLANHVFAGFDAPVALAVGRGGARPGVGDLIARGGSQCGGVGSRDGDDVQERYGAW